MKFFSPKMRIFDFVTKILAQKVAKSTFEQYYYPKLALQLLLAYLSSGGASALALTSAAASLSMVTDSL